MDKVWKDYLARRPGTIGGEMGLKEDQVNMSIAQQVFTAPSASASNEKVATAPRAPRVPYRFKGSDLVVAVAVFLATWLVLWRSSNMGGGTAAAAGFFAGCLAARWWRQLLVLIIAALGVAIYLHSH